MTEIDDKTRAQVLRWALDEIPMDDDMQAALRGWIDDLDPPEPKFEDGDYALWTPGGARLLATRNATGGAVPWWVGFGSYTDDRVRVAFSRIEKLRIADDDEVIIKREDVEWVAQYLRAFPPMTQAKAIHADRIKAALNEQGGEQR